MRTHERAEMNNAAVVLVLVVHLAWILWVIFGALWTSGRRGLTAFHIASLVWGIIVEVGPWPCPLTMAEDFFQQRAGVESTAEISCSIPLALSSIPMFQ